MKRDIFNKLASFLCVLILMVSFASGGTYEQKASFEKIIEVEFTKDDFVFDKINGYDVVSLEEEGYLADPGKPLLPAKQIRVALPRGIKVANVYVKDFVLEPVKGRYNLMPAQPPAKICSGDIEFVGANKLVYGSSKPYPTEKIELLGQNDLAGQGIAVITINPLQYIPNEGKLNLYSSMTIVIKGVDGYEYGDYLPAGISDSSRESYENRLKELVFNPEDVNLEISGDPVPTSLEEGTYDYVIITTSSWNDEFERLAEWKTKKGTPAKVVTTDWIYSEYSGSNDQKIRSFVIDAYNEWGAIYFLLGGDANYVPYNLHYFPIDPYNIPNDTYYADFDDDWVVEVHVGRASANNENEVNLFIDKVLTYEKNPPLSDFGQTAALFGFNLDGSTPGENCKRDIDNSYIPSDWDMSNVYDSDPGNHRTNVLAALNDGQNLINHIDHSYIAEMGTGSYYHGWHISTGDMINLNNGDRLGNLYTIGCWANAFDYPTAISEGFVRAENGGGTGFVGNTRYGWYNPGTTNTLSMRYDRYFFRSIFSQGHYMLGEAFSDHKNDYIPNNNYYRYVWTELTLLGDPQLPLWMDDPHSLVVEHPGEIEVGPGQFSVHVEESGSGNLEEAYVTVWKDAEVYLSDYTNLDGDVTFILSPETIGTMYVTVIKQDFVPYEGDVDVVYTPVLPDPLLTYVELSDGGLFAPPDGDSSIFEYVTVYVRDSNNESIPGIPSWEFVWTKTGGDVTLLPVDFGTNEDGRIRFIARANENIAGYVTLEVEIRSVDILDSDDLPCNSPDYNDDGRVDMDDFVVFAEDWGTDNWESDFDWNRFVELGDLVMFAVYWGYGTGEIGLIPSIKSLK